MEQYSIPTKISLWYDWHFRYRYYRWKEKTEIWIAWNLVPRWLAKWVIVRYFALATGNDKHPDEVTYREVYEAVDPKRSSGTSR